MFRYIKPSRTHSVADTCCSLNALTKQSDTEMLLNHNGKVYKFKFTVEQFASLRQFYEMFNKAKEHLAKYFEEV